MSILLYPLNKPLAFVFSWGLSYPKADSQLKEFSRGIKFSCIASRDGCTAWYGTFWLACEKDVLWLANCLWISCNATANNNKKSVFENVFMADGSNHVFRSSGGRPPIWSWNLKRETGTAAWSTATAPLIKKKLTRWAKALAQVTLLCPCFRTLDWKGQVFLAYRSFLQFLGVYSASCSFRTSGFWCGFGESDSGAGELEEEEQADASSSCNDGQFSMLLLSMFWRLLLRMFEAMGMPFVELSGILHQVVKNHFNIKDSRITRLVLKLFMKFPFVFLVLSLLHIILSKTSFLISWGTSTI